MNKIFILAFILLLTSNNNAQAKHADSLGIILSTVTDPYQQFDIIRAHLDLVNSNVDSASCMQLLKIAQSLKNDSLLAISYNRLGSYFSFTKGKKTEEVQERKQNIQYTLIALAVIILLTLYLILSRGFITNTRLIEFLAVITLLLVYDLLHSWLHPFLESITHHSPVLMLLALICIAALLVPLYRKLEKWATRKLVEKNKRVRLEAAKKAIIQLEKSRT
jgi:hypothetical protein